MFRSNLPTVTDDLRILIGDRATTLSPSQGFDLAEELARKSFRLAMAQEAAALQRHGEAVPRMAHPLG